MQMAQEDRKILRDDAADIIFSRRKKMLRQIADENKAKLKGQPRKFPLTAKNSDEPSA